MTAPPPSRQQTLLTIDSTFDILTYPNTLPLNEQDNEPLNERRNEREEERQNPSRSLFASCRTRKTPKSPHGGGGGGLYLERSVLKPKHPEP
jgi:hypothetical protein